MTLTGLMCGMLLASSSTPQTENAPDLRREISITNTIGIEVVPAPKPPASVVVKAGDNDVKIAKRLGISAAQLRKANPGVNWTKIKPGQTLKTGVSSSSTKKTTAAKKPAATAKMTQAKASTSNGVKGHIVVKGENDWIIAKKYGITPSKLAKLNPKVNWTKIKPGMKILVPKSGSSATKSASQKFASQSSATKITTKRVRVTADNVYVRSGPNTTAKPLTKVSKNRVASVVDRSGDWYKIKFAGGTTGWIRGDLLKPVSATEASRLLASAKKASASSTKVAKASSPKSSSPRSAMRVASNTNYAKTSLIDTAKSNLGIRYSWGGTSRGGFDCSGFVGWVYARHGVKLPRTSIQQSTYGHAIAKENLEKGDLVFFKTTRGNRVSHVGIYIGGGQFIHASSGSGRVVISGLGEGYYSKRYAGARRVTGAKGAAKLDSYVEQERDEIRAAQKKSDADVKKAKAEAEKAKIEAAAKEAEKKVVEEGPNKVTVGADVIGK